MKLASTKQIPVLAAGVALAAALFACSSDEGKAPAPVPRAHEPAVEPTAPTAGASGAGARTRIESVTAAVPRAWQKVQPANPMRKAEFNLPGADGAEDASVTVYTFGPQAGTMEANLDRWKNQMRQDPADNAKVTKVDRAGGTPITLLDVRGTFSAGMGDATSHAGWRMLAAVVDAKDATYYFKLVGPAATVEKWAGPYREMLASVEDAK